MGTTEALATFLAETGFENFNAALVERGKLLVIDFIGGALGGANTKVGRMLESYIIEKGGKPEARVIGRNFQTTAGYAAYLNGVFNHATELESVSKGTSPNPLAVIATSLAVAEKMNLGGPEVLEGVVLGFEIQGRVGQTSLKGVSKTGRISIFNHLGTAAAASKLMKLDAHQTRMALGIAAFQAGGLITTVGTMAHVLELAVSARDGIEAAELAKRGGTSHPDIIEAPQGFCDALIEAGEYDLDKMTENLGKTYQIAAPGISIKKYPCCYRAHRALDALFDILSEEQISYDEIERVTVELNLYDSYLMKFPVPQTGEEAKFSFEHILGAAILKGKVWVDSFTEESVIDPKYLEARSKVDVVIHSEWPPGRAEARTPVTLKLIDGREFSKEAGSPREPSVEQLLGRYRQAADSILTPDQKENSIELLLNMDRVRDVSEVMRLVTSRK
jgi:2-methylcitrate dehydratase PrpD